MRLPDRMTARARALRFLPVVALVGVFLVPGSAALADRGGGRDDDKGPIQHIFVIMLENHSQSSVIDDVNAPYITSLAHTYGMASNYFGVTHPSLPNYVAAISGSNWFINDDDPSHRFDHTNLVDQLESNHRTWAAYMDSMPSAGFLGDQYPANAALYVSKHDPFVLMSDIRNNPVRLARIKPYTSFAADMASKHIPDFVWISPNQCNDMHGGVFVTVAPDGSDGTPCPFGSAKDDPNDAALKAKADTFVKGAVSAIMDSRAWRENSAIFIVTDENDFVAANLPVNDGWESAAGCCDSPVLPDGYKFLNSHSLPDGNVWHGVPDGNGGTTFVYGGGLIPAIVVRPHGLHGFVSDAPYNHYSLLRTIEWAWDLGYLGNASDSAQVQAMTEFLR
jgi:hypothetical protein